MTLASAPTQYPLRHRASKWQVRPIGWFSFCVLTKSKAHQDSHDKWRQNRNSTEPQVRDVIKIIGDSNAVERILKQSGFQFSVFTPKPKQLQWPITTNATTQSRWANESKKQIHVTGAKRGKMYLMKSPLVLVLHLIGWIGDASLLNESEGRRFCPNVCKIENCRFISETNNRVL